MAARRRLLRWGSWFALVNAGVLALVGLRYLWYYAAVGPSVTWIYALAAFVGQMAVFAFVPFLDDLERRELLESTVVILPSDHGTEFNENGQGFTGHGTSFSAHQVRTPFVLRQPGRPPARISRRTSHNDLAPTLLTELFGCTNPPADYASGQSLFSDRQWEWLITLSHNDFALLEPDQVTIVYPSDNEVRDQSYRLIQHPRLSRDKLRAAMQEMSRFFN